EQRLQRYLESQRWSGRIEFSGAAKNRTRCHLKATYRNTSRSASSGTPARWTQLAAEAPCHCLGGTGWASFRGASFRDTKLSTNRAFKTENTSGIHTTILLVRRLAPHPRTRSPVNAGSRFAVGEDLGDR